MPENQFVLTFGGGINARRRVADVQPDECVPPSENFDLDGNNRALFRRKPFDLVATAPNAGSINGFAQLIKQNNAISTLVQAGEKVYSWDGGDTFNEVGEVSAQSRLRGPREQNFTLNEYVIITDLEKQTVVKKWDGTTFQDLEHDLGGQLFAKYCRVYNERNFLGNVRTTIDTPHVLLASEGSDGEKFSTADRPTSSLGADAPWFLPTPDLRPINGMDEAFGQFIISTQRGRLYILSGQDSFDYSIDPLHIGSAVVGDEAIKNIGNDVILGLDGRIEALSGVLNFGDVESDDLSLPIARLLKNATEWTIEYDRRNQKVLCFPKNQSVVYVLHKTLVTDPNTAGVLSAWSKWSTTHPTFFNPTTVMQLVNPIDKQDVVYFGDASGNIYVTEGEGGQDGGTDDITVRRRSGLLAVPEGNEFNFHGWILYRTLFEVCVTLRLLGGGVAIWEQEVELCFPVNENLVVYKGDSYYNDGKSPYGLSFLTGRIHRQDWCAAGQSSNLQLEVEVSGAADFNVEEIGIEFTSETT